MTEDIGIDKVKPIDCSCNNNEELEVFIVRLVKIVYAAVGVVGVAFELGGATVDAVEVFVFKGHHVGVVVVDEIAYAAQGSIDDGDFPRLTIVYLSGTGQEGKEQGFGGVVRCGVVGRLYDSGCFEKLLCLHGRRCLCEEQKHKYGKKNPQVSTCGEKGVCSIALQFRHEGRAVS